MNLFRYYIRFYGLLMLFGKEFTEFEARGVWGLDLNFVCFLLISWICSVEGFYYRISILFINEYNYFYYGD